MATTKCRAMTDVELNTHMSVMARTPGKYAARQFRNALDEMIRREEPELCGYCGEPLDCFGVCDCAGAKESSPTRTLSEVAADKTWRW